MTPLQNKNMFDQQYGNQLLHAALAIALGNDTPENNKMLDSRLSHLMSEQSQDVLGTLLTRTPNLSSMQHKLGLTDLTQKQLDDALSKARALIQERAQEVGNTLINNIETSMSAISPETSNISGDKMTIPDAQKLERDGI